MNIFGLNISFNKSVPAAKSPFKYNGDYHSFGGEKTPYELGTPLNFEPDYYSLRLYAWEAFLKTDIVQNAVRKYILWIVGAGLKLQSDPVTKSDIKDSFVSEVEQQFRLYADLKISTYNEMQNLHAYAGEALKTALLSGDCLCVIRYYDNSSIEVIDGCFVSTPLGYKTENTIIDGVEIDSKGKHIAYHVENDDFTWTRIPAYGARTGRLQAWLMYGLKYKLNGVRGMSFLGAVMETVDKLDRYKSAAVSSAEENSKIPFTFEHNQFSDGENPLISQFAQSIGKGKGVAPETESATLDGYASRIAQTTDKQVFNLPVGASLKRNNFETDINFSEFFSANIDIVYATLGMPPEVALDKFGGSYSGSRAALKSWEYKMFVDRKNVMKDQFYRPFFEFWLDMQILKNNIKNNDYLRALNNNDFMALAAWRNCRFIGVTVPHIDPLKEVNAERRKLGTLYDAIPLTTAEQSCENLNSGDYDTVQNITNKELENGTKISGAVTT